MEPILRKKYLKSEYIFYPNLIQKVKNGKIIKQIKLENIKEITYNEKFGLNDFFGILLDRLKSYYNLPKAFVVILNTNPSVFSIKLEREEYEILKKGFLKPIKLI